jgi:hypothetical protein
MKINKINTIIVIVVLQFVTFSVFSQVKITSNGNISLGHTNTPGYSLDVKGYVYKFNRKDMTSNNLEINHWGIDPRIGSKNRIVFFYGSNYVDIECKTLIEHSDSTQKEQITYIKGSGLDKVLKLKGVSYYWKKNGNSTKSEKKEIGFLAQEVENVIPEVVYTIDSTNLKMISYTHMLPYITEAIKELNDKIIELENELGTNKSLKSGTLNTIDEKNSNAKLFQNAPNPFTQETVIKYELPDIYQNASISIFDMQGLPVKTIKLTNFDNNQVIITGNELNAGLYIYVLIGYS